MSDRAPIRLSQFSKLTGISKGIIQKNTPNKDGKPENALISCHHTQRGQLLFTENDINNLTDNILSKLSREHIDHDLLIERYKAYDNSVKQAREKRHKEVKTRKQSTKNAVHEYTRAAKCRITDVCDNDDDIDVLIEMFFFFTDQYDLMLQNREAIDQLVGDDSLTSAGKFRDRCIKLMPLYDNWDYPGRKAENFRFLTGQLLHLLRSVDERIRIARVCEKFDWKNTQKLRDALTEEKLYPTGASLANICRSMKVPEVPCEDRFVMDYTTQNPDSAKRDGGSFYLLLRGRTIKIDIPVGIRDKHVSKPSFFADDNGEFWCTFAYNEALVELHDVKDGVCAYDWGKVLPVSCAAVYKDGSFTPQFVATHETRNLRKSIDDISIELSSNYKKLNNIEALLGGKKQYPDAVRSVKAIRHAIAVLRNKRSRMRAHYAQLVARDVVEWAMFATRTDELHYENLQDMDESWKIHEFGLIEEALGAHCERHGFVALQVSMRDTSHEDPFTGERVSPDGDRVTSTVGGDINRDYAASLVMAHREPVRARWRSRHRVPRPVPGKCSGSGPVIVNPERRKHSHKVEVRSERDCSERERLRAERMARRERLISSGVRDLVLGLIAERREKSNASGYYTAVDNTGAAMDSTWLQRTGHCKENSEYPTDYNTVTGKN